MIAAISSAESSFEETLNTLKYANRAKNIKSTVRRNVLNVDYHISEYVSLINNLRNEIKNLKDQLHSGPLEVPSTANKFTLQPIAREITPKNIIPLSSPLNSIRDSFRSNGQGVPGVASESEGQGIHIHICYIVCFILFIYAYNVYLFVMMLQEEPVEIC